MKRHVFVIMIVFSLIACESKTKDTDPKIDQINSYAIGKTHNEILSFLKSKSVTYSSIDLTFSQIGEYMINEKNYDSDLVKEGIQNIKSNQTFDQLVSTKADDQVSIDTYLSDAKIKLGLSEEFTTRIKEAITLCETANAEVVKDYVTNNIENVIWTGSDEQAAVVFTDVFMHSYDYWTSQGTKGPNKDQWVIIDDAIGALHGLIFGPVVSIIEGAIVSYVVAAD